MKNIYIVIDSPDEDDVGKLCTITTNTVFLYRDIDDLKNKSWCLSISDINGEPVLNWKRYKFKRLKRTEVLLESL